MEWHDLLGILGGFMIVMMYFLLQTGRVTSSGFPYLFLNGIGALLILLSLLVDFNLSAFVIELFWLLISLFGLFQWYKKRKTDTTYTF